MKALKLISIVTPCFNEEKNVEPLYESVKAIFAELPEVRYEHLFIDNASTDDTVANLKRIAAKDRNVKIIVNMRNFGHIRSPYYAMQQTTGDAVITMACDFQDPPEIIPKLIKHWQEGSLLVVAVKLDSKESKLVYALRTLYYKLLNLMADINLIQHFTGFGLYDRRVIDELKKLNDKYPYLRGLVSELGFQPVRIPFVQPQRKHGKSHINLYHLYDLAMLGLTSYSIVPMRIATIFGFFLAILSFAASLFYLTYKLIYWRQFSLGIAPVLVGMFFLSSVQLIFVGLLGEYIGAVHTQVLTRPLVVERERINFGPS